MRSFLPYYFLAVGTFFLVRIAVKLVNARDLARVQMEVVSKTERRLEKVFFVGNFAMLLWTILQWVSL